MINVKIARLAQDGKETYGLVKDGDVATKENMTYQTGVPLPLGIMDFLFEGWYDEIKDKISSTSFQDDIEKFRLLDPLPNPSKIICLAFNYPKHAKEQNYESTKEPVIFIKPRTTLCGTNSEIRCPNFVKQLDYEIKDTMSLFKPSSDVLTDFHVYQTFFELVPEGTSIHMANSSVIRYCQLFDPIKGCNYFANRGTSGIDGSTSTALGYAHLDEQLNVLITGDVSFLYDSNALRLRALATNLKIILINNQGGGIFRIIEGAKSSQQLEQYFEAQHSSDGKLAAHAGWSYKVSSSVDSIEETLQEFFDSTAVNFIEFKTEPIQSPQTLKDFFTFVR
mgnify:CR=1 FL=1